MVVLLETMQSIDGKEEEIKVGASASMVAFISCIVELLETMQSIDGQEAEIKVGTSASMVAFIS
jgi:hypothetical protein